MLVFLKKKISLGKKTHTVDSDPFHYINIFWLHDYRLEISLD